jgi:hypothetical protein
MVGLSSGVFKMADGRESNLGHLVVRVVKLSKGKTTSPFIFEGVGPLKLSVDFGQYPLNPYSFRISNISLIGLENSPLANRILCIQRTGDYFGGVDIRGHDSDGEYDNEIFCTPDVAEDNYAFGEYLGKAVTKFIEPAADWVLQDSGYWLPPTPAGSELDS